MRRLTRGETQEFLQAYYRGILENGLLEPLQKLAASNESPLAQAARSLYDLQLSGLLPQVAISLVQPSFPYRVGLLMALGFEQSRLDHVLADTLEAYRLFSAEAELATALDGLLEKYSHLLTEEICRACSDFEIKKILVRSKAERASTVLVEYGDGFLRQKFISSKLVEIREPAIPAVFRTLKQAFSQLSMPSSGPNEFSIEVKHLVGLEFEVKTAERVLKIQFVE